MTEQRKTIKQIILDSPKHLTAEEIFMLAKERMPKIAFGTVYRNLGILASNNEIIKIVSITGVIHYDKRVEHHEHTVCEKCGKVEDIMELDLTDYISKYKEKYHITGFECVIKNICKDCLNSKE